jgi:hypothetical protein
LKIYAVGGAVRDELLGLPVQDRDWVVVGATPEEMAARGFTAVGKDFPVFLHPETHEEYALARTERKTGRGYHGFAFHTAPEVDVVEVILAAPADKVHSAVADVLTQGGYSVDQDEAGNVTTGMRQEVRGPWNGLLRWRFGIGKSRVEARVVPLDDNSTRLRLQVFYRGKDGLFDTWEEAETPLPQSAANEVRLIKNALRIL